MKTNIIRLILTLLFCVGIAISYTPEKGLQLNMGTQAWAMDDDDDYYDDDDGNYYDDDDGGYWDGWDIDDWCDYITSGDAWDDGIEDTHIWDDPYDFYENADPDVVDDVLESLEYMGYDNDHIREVTDNFREYNDEWREREEKEREEKEREEECNGTVCDICGKIISNSIWRAKGIQRANGANCETCPGHVDDHNVCNPNSIAYNPRQCRDRCGAYQTMWNNSFSSSYPNGIRETGGFILADGSYYILDNSNNDHNVTRWPDFKFVGDYAYAIMPDGSGMQIVGIIHTHPNSGSTFVQGPTIPEDFTSLADFGGIDKLIYGYVISADNVYRYYFDDDGNRITETLGSRSSFSECE
jgi:hypothetical protein